MDKIMSSKLPFQLTSGVGKVKSRITQFGEDPVKYVETIRNAYFEYSKLVSQR